MIALHKVAEDTVLFRQLHIYISLYIFPGGIRSSQTKAFITKGWVVNALSQKERKQKKTGGIGGEIAKTSLFNCKKKNLL